MAKMIGTDFLKIGNKIVAWSSIHKVEYWPALPERLFDGDPQDLPYGSDPDNPPMMPARNSCMLIALGTTETDEVGVSSSVSILCYGEDADILWDLFCKLSYESGVRP